MNRGPLILAIVLLLLPVLYVGSYLALVNPSGHVSLKSSLFGNARMLNEYVEHYRVGGESAATFYWPLEQVDRKFGLRSWSDLVPKENRSPHVPEKTVPAV